MARYAAVCDQINDYISLSNTNLGVATSADVCFGTFIRIPDNSGSAFKYFLSNGAFGATNKFNAYIDEDSAGGSAIPNSLTVIPGNGTASRTSATFDWTVEKCVIVSRVSGSWSVWIGDSDGTMTQYALQTDNTAIDSSGWELNRRTDGNVDRYFGGEQSRIFWAARGVDQTDADSIASGTDPATVFGVDIVANYLYDEGSGSTISDTEGSNTGTLQNFPTDGSQWVLVDGSGAITGSADHQSQTSTHTASGQRTATGTASHQAAQATQSASGEVGSTITGSASHQAASATHSATGNIIAQGTAAHSAQASTQSATGEVSGAVTGEAIHSATSATQAATGTRIAQGSASHTAQTATHAASGEVGNVISGTASHAANDATHSATGFRVIQGTGAHQSQPSTQSAAGSSAGAVTGAGDHQATAARQSALGLRVITGSAAHHAQTATQATTVSPGFTFPLGATSVRDDTPALSVSDDSPIYSVSSSG